MQGYKRVCGLLAGILIPFYVFPPHTTTSAQGCLTGLLNSLTVY